MTSKPQRNLYVFGATSFLNDTASEMAYWILPAFLGSLGAGPAALGLIEGVAESSASFTKLLSGYLADRLPRRKPIVVGGYAVANLVKPLLAVATAWWQVLFIRFADRTAKGMRGAPRDVMLAESVPVERVGAAFGLMQAMDSAGSIAGPLLALAIVGHFGFRGVFWAAAVPGLASVAVMALLARETPLEARRSRPKSKDASAAARPRLSTSFYWTMSAVALFSLGNSSDMFLVLRAQDAGIAVVYAPLLGLVFNVVYTLASWPAGRLSDRVSRSAMTAAGFLVFAAVYVVFALAPSRAALWAMMGFYGLFYALTNPVLRAMIAATVAPEARGRAFGIFYFVSSVAMLFASLLTGELWKHFGARVPFLLSAGLAAAAAVMLLFVRAPGGKGGAEREMA
ncbi:MAG: MFS transporter, partial [Terriglobales bacterium]